MACGRFACPCDAEARKDAPRPRPWPWEATRGCGDAEAPRPVAKFEGRPLMRCAARLVEPWAWDVLQVHAGWERGILPGPGGLLDQPAPLIDALRLLDGQVADERRRAEQRESDRVKAAGKRR